MANVIIRVCIFSGEASKFCYCGPAQSRSMVNQEQTQGTNNHNIESII